jgi:hypothetical protein
MFSRIDILALSTFIACGVFSCASNEEKHLTTQELSTLAAFRAEPKFGSQPELGYFGAPNEEVRTRCEAAINQLLDELIAGWDANPTKAFVLAQFERTLEKFNLEDSEEQDQALSYLERIMDILGIESSDGLLNTWRYGFNPR